MVTPSLMTDKKLRRADSISLDISVIIVAWNTQKCLVNCLRSLLEDHAGYSQEIIVVDNGSSDGSVETVESEFPHVKLVRNSENLGFAKANNIGIRASTGRYVCLVNSDVIVLDGCVGKLMEFMDQNPNIGMAGPRVLNPDRTLQVSCRHFPTIWNNLCQAFGLNKVFPKSEFFSDWFMDYWNHDSIRSVDVLSGCFWMVRRKALDEVGLLDEDFFIYGEDIDWCKRFHEAGWDMMFYPEAEAIHFGGASSSNAPIRFFLEMQKADLQYWRKHHGQFGVLIYWIIILLRQLARIPTYILMYIFQAKHREIWRFKLRRAFACICFLFGSSIDK